MAKTNTPKFGLPQWGLPTDTVLRSDFNEAFSNIEGRAVKETRGTLASRPAFGNPGAYHLDTATGVRYRDTGTGWTPETVSASAIYGVIPVQNIPTISANNVLGGVFQEDQIPPLDASKVASGALDPARIPPLSASKTTSGTFDTARIPSLDASKIGSGTLPLARIPTLDAALVPTLDASKIGTGALPVARGGRGYTTDWAWIPDNPYFYSNYYVRARDGVFEYLGHFIPKAVTLTGPVGLGILPPDLRPTGDLRPVSVIPVYVNRPGIGLYSAIAANGDLGVSLSPYQGSVLLHGDNQIVPIIPPYVVAGA